MRQRLQTNQKGVAHLMLILVVVVIVGVGGVGYYVWNKQKSDSPGGLTNSDKKALEVECKKAIDDKDFCKFASNVNFEEDYKATITSTSAEGSSVMVMESSGDNSSVVTSVNGQTVSEYITIGNASYIKNVFSGTWTKYVDQTDPTDTSSEDLDVDIEEEITDENTKYEKIGKEACGSLTCFKYKITDSEDPDSEQYVWFDDDDYKLRRFSYKNAEGTSDVTYSYESVSISEPSPVEDAADF